MKALSYSLFGYGKQKQESGFDFMAFMRDMMIILRTNRLIFPDWINVIHIDTATHEAYKSFWEKLSRTPNVVIKVQPEEPLCKAMLWRLKPIFERNFDVEANGFTTNIYSHVLCRDLDSPSTYRDAQAVKYWIDKGKAAHAITDSQSHNLPMLGGAIGFVPAHFITRTGWNSWDEMMFGKDYPFDVKGSDQDFLNRHIYPKFAQHGNDSITQHYFDGCPNTFLSDYHTCLCKPTAGHADNCPNNYPVDLPDEMKESNSTCGHIGSAGYYTTAMFRFLYKHKDKFVDLLEIEKDLPTIFYWTKDGTFI